MNKTKKAILMILDGWGEGDKTPANAMNRANIPFIRSLYTKAACCHLKVSGEDVGLPDGQMGNSEVGHLNIGAGRIVYQDFVRINLAIKDNSIEHNKAIHEVYKYAKRSKRAVHFFGLVSEGGVHSCVKHLMKLCDMAKERGLEKVFVHAFTDGRDTDPHSGLQFLTNLDNYLKTSAGKIATVCGRYYAMDRDKRWERIKLAYDLIVHGQGQTATSAAEAMQKSYDEGITDEFIKPFVIVDQHQKPLAMLKEGDVAICFNFRTDRLREITTVLTQQDMPEFGMKTIPLHYVTMTRYDETFKHTSIIFDKDDLKNTIGEVISDAGKTQLRIAETEKYPHVTFFFSGGREHEFPGESRVMIHSPQVATYDLKPSMSAVEVKDAVIQEINKNTFDFICLNFANADMVGHTGVMPAIIEALETVDGCVKEVTEAALKQGYSVMITADHGNADHAINGDGTPNTAHSMNPVPCFLLDNDYHKLQDGRLCDIAPTLLNIMNLPIPSDMTGKVLCVE